jgi:hypothetical protein
MSMPTESEMAALSEAGPLLRFAAEHVTDLESSLSLAVAKAVEASQNQNWTPEISQSFWNAYSRLCDHIKPVTIDSLLSNRRTIQSHNWLKFWRGGKSYSIAERTSRRYLVALGIVLSVTIVLQLYVWTTAKISDRVDDLLKDLTVRSANLTSIYSQLPFGTNLTQPQAVLATQVQVDSNALAKDAIRTVQYSSLLENISSFFRVVTVPELPKVTSEEWYDRYHWATDLVQSAKAYALRTEVNASLISGTFLSFFLPVMFGIIGSIAYVIRLISDQMRSTTFSSISPISNLMRVMLGALMGVVIGLFNGLSNQVSLPPLALAFLAGYGVEAFFSIFDGLIEKFRQPEPGRPIAS